MKPVLISLLHVTRWLVAHLITLSGHTTHDDTYIITNAVTDTNVL